MEEKSFQPATLVHQKENTYFWIVLIFSISTYVFFAISIIGVFILLAMLALSLFMHALMIGHIRTNAVKLSPAQFTDVYEITAELCERMEISQVPDVYVMESAGALNAFATRFFGRNMVVIYSEIFELKDHGGKQELYFVIAHELAHIKRNHISKMMAILPAMWVPGIGEMYLRACEYTCDRYAAYYTGNTEAAKNSLTILGVGKSLYLKVNRTEYLEQINNEKGLFVWLSEKLSSHPPLPKRINEIALFFGQEDEAVIKQKRSRAVWLVAPAALLILGISLAGGYALLKDQGFSEVLSDYDESMEFSEDTPPLIEAVINSDTAKAAKLIQEGEDIEAIDYEEYTALHWAVMDQNREMAEILLNAGADPNAEDLYGMTPLMSAAELGNPGLVELLVNAGADPNYQDYETGMTSLFHAVYSTDIETVERLLDLGADPAIKDYQNMTALMHAIQSNNREASALLKKEN